MMSLAETWKDLPEQMSIAEVARILRVSKSLMYRLAREGDPPTFKNEKNRITVHRDKFIAWVDSNTGK